MAMVSSAVSMSEHYIESNWTFRLLNSMKIYFRTCFSAFFLFAWWFTIEKQSESKVLICATTWQIIWRIWSATFIVQFMCTKMLQCGIEIEWCFHMKFPTHDDISYNLLLFRLHQNGMASRFVIILRRWQCEHLHGVDCHCVNTVTNLILFSEREKVQMHLWICVLSGRKHMFYTRFALKLMHNLIIACVGVEFKLVL